MEQILETAVDRNYVFQDSRHASGIDILLLFARRLVRRLVRVPVLIFIACLYLPRWLVRYKK